MKIRAQIGMVLNLDKCIGCHTCSVTCKNVWTNREGVEALTATSYVLTHSSSEAGNIIRAQFIDPLNFEEQVIEVTLSTTNRSIPFNLEPEINV